MPDQIEPAAFPHGSVSITGGTGTVGSQFLKVLLAQFPHVENISTTCRPDSPRAHRIPDAQRVNVVRGSINNLDVLSRIVDEGEVVYHLAAWLANTPLPSMTAVYVTNSLATGVISRLCAHRQKPLVFTSSHSVYFAGDYRGEIREDDYSFRRDFVEWINAVSDEYSRLIDAIIAGEADFGGAPEAVERIHEKLPPPFKPKIYDNDSYHVYCLTKLLAERFVLDSGGLVLRLSNVYGPGDESVQAVGEACHRLLEADPGERIEVRQPFKRLVPAYLGDIVKCLIRAAGLRLPDDVSPVFLVASQEHYMREDALLRTVADALNEIRGTEHAYDIEELPPEEETAFSYDLTKTRAELLYGEPLTPFGEGVKQQLIWLMERAEGRPAAEAAFAIRFHDGDA